jgi:membrane protease YdiL (CAAX protease family)
MVQTLLPTTREPATHPPRDPPRWWTAPPVAPVDRRRIATEVVAMLVLIAVPGLLIGLEGIGDPRSIQVDEIGVLELLASVASSAGGAMLATQLLWRDGLLQVAGFHRRKAGMILGYGVLGLVCCYVALVIGVIVGSGVYAAFGGDLEALYDEAESSAGTSGSSAALLAVAYVIAITAGITEEILFRAYAITRLEQLGWGRWAAIASAIVFATLHLYQGVVAFFGIAAITVVFTFLYRWKRTLLPLMLAHALYDAVQLTIAILR